MKDEYKQIESGEFELPETTYVRDVESRVFQGIILQCITKIDGVSLSSQTFFDSLLGRESQERGRGIYVEQDLKKHSVHIKIEVNIEYGLKIPEKAEEIQTKIAEMVSKLSGLHVSCVHVIFKNLIVENEIKEKQDEVEEIKEDVAYSTGL